MSGPANTTPFTFKYQTGQRCLLNAKQLKAGQEAYAIYRDRNPNAFGGFTQPVERIKTAEGKVVIRRKHFVKLSGNGCAHDKRALKTLVDANPYDKMKGKPEKHVIQGKPFDLYGNRLRSNAQYKAIKRIDRYTADTSAMPSIEAARKAIKRKNGGGKVRKHRSEGREAICRTLSTLLMNMDVHSFRVGKPDVSNRKLFYYHRNEKLAAESGLGAKRFQRHLELLAAAGIIKMKRQWEELKDGYKGKASAIWFTRGFMKSMNLLNLFNRTSEQLTSRLKKNEQRDAKTPEQVQAEATDKLCQEASKGVVPTNLLKRSVKELYSFIDTEDPPEFEF